MSGQTIDVFCDGSVTNSVLTVVFSSAIGEDYVGRAIVLVPTRDIGVVAQTRNGMLSQRGNPASDKAEVFAIRTALDLCKAKGFSNYAVYSDCQGAVQRFEAEPVEWRSRHELRLPNDFFDKVLRRASYLRSSSRKVSRRIAPQAHHIEAFELFNAPLLEFRLSQSTLWERVCRDAIRHPRTIGM